MLIYKKFFLYVLKIIFFLFKKINKYFNNWSISIIIFALIIKIITYPLNKIQYNYNLKTYFLQLKINKIKSNFKDKNKKNKEILLLYKKINLNSIKILFLIFIKTPIFIILNYIILNTNELKNSRFFWINDLSCKDKFYILPILIGISIFIIQKKSLFYKNIILEKKIFFIIPFIFTILFSFISSGLILYYLFNNIFLILEQILINKIFNKKIKNYIVNYF